MELSLSHRIARYVKGKNDWVSGKEIEDLVIQHTKYKASNASRRCREMESGNLSNGGTCPILFEKQTVRGAVQYRWSPRESETDKIISNMPEAVRVFDAL